MASRGQSLTIQYTAWDTANNQGKTGDAANHTLRWIKDGTASATANSPTEVDATNAPGVYKVTLTSTECTCDFGTLAGKSASAAVVIIPVHVSFEQLPTAAAGSNGGLPTVDGNNHIAGIQGTKNQLDDLNDVDAATVKAQVDAALDTAIPTTPTANSINERIKTLDDNYTAARAGNLDNLDAPVSSRSDFDETVDAVTISGAKGTLDDLNDLSAAEVNAEVLDVLTVDTFGEPAGVPAATSSLKDKLVWLFALARNKRVTTALQDRLRNDADDGNIATASLSDDGTEFTRGEWS